MDSTKHLGLLVTKFGGLEIEWLCAKLFSIQLRVDQRAIIIRVSHVISARLD